MVHAFPDDRWSLLLPGRGAIAGVAARWESEQVALRRTRTPGRLLHGSGAITGRPRVDRMLDPGLDIMWVPAPAPIALSASCPRVLTMHDLTFEERPRDFTPYERLWHALARPRLQAQRAQRVIVNSASTRDALLERWELDPSRLMVIPEGVTRPVRTPTATEIEGVRRRHGLLKRYLLAVGALEPRKAPDLLVAAYAQARRAGLDAQLVFAGRGRMARGLRGPGVRLLGYVSDRDLDALYAGALGLVMPSYLEGFGLPPLEALVRGTPAVISDLPVYDETLGDGALRFPAGDETALATALGTLAGDGELRRSLVARGQRAIAGLTWEAAALRTRAVLAEAAGVTK